MAGLDERLAEQSAPLLIRAAGAAAIAAVLFEQGHLQQAELHEDQRGLTVRVPDADAFHLAFNELVVREGWRIEAFGPADETARAAYRHWLTDDVQVRAERADSQSTPDVTRGQRCGGVKCAR